MNRSAVAIATVLVATTVLGGTAAGTALAAPDRVGVSHAGGDRSPDRAQQERLVRNWLQLWNGSYRISPQIVSADVRLHAALMDGGDGSAIKGPAGMVAWIKQLRAAFPDLRFSVQVGPIVDRGQIVVRWSATGTYGGGFPGATAEPGTRVTFTGTDILRVEHGKIVEYWLNADTLLLVNQLKVTAG